MEFAIIALLLLVVVWVVHTRRTLCELSDNVSTAMSQVCLQLSARFRALTALRELAKFHGLLVPADYALPNVDARSTPAQVLAQEQQLAAALHSLVDEAQTVPAMLADPAYRRCVEAADCYSRMIFTSSMIYNDSVSRLNHALQRMPTRLIAGALGFSVREYLELAPDAPVRTLSPQTQAS